MEQLRVNLETTTVQLRMNYENTTVVLQMVTTVFYTIFKPGAPGFLKSFSLRECIGVCVHPWGYK